MRIHNDAAFMPVNVVVGANTGFPVRFYLHDQAFLVAPGIQPQNFVDSQAVPVSDKAVLRWPEELPAEFEGAASGPRARKSPF